MAGVCVDDVAQLPSALVDAAAPVADALSVSLRDGRAASMPTEDLT